MAPSVAVFARSLLVASLTFSACATPTTLLVAVAQPADVPILSLAVDVQVQGEGTSVHHVLPPDGGPPTLPGSFVIELPDEMVTVQVNLSATDGNGDSIVSMTSVVCEPHRRTKLSVMLGAPPEAGDAGL